MYLVISEKMLNLGLKPIETMLLAQITSFKKEGCYMSVNTLKKMFNVSYNTIVRALDTLEKKNLIKRCGYTENKTVLFVSLFKDDNQENNQDNKQERTENAKDEPKEEKTVNTTPNKEKDENKPNTSDYKHIQDDNSSSNIDDYNDLFYDEYDYI